MTNLDSKSYVDWIDLSQIAIPRYQRPPPTDIAIARMAEEWDDNAAGVIYVAYRDGYFWAIDGQARVKAALIAKGLSGKIEAKIYVGLTEEEESGLFVRYNRDHRMPAPVHTFLALLISGDPVATGIRDILADLGLSVGVSKGKRLDKIEAVTALQHVYLVWGPQVLRSVIEVLCAVWPDDPRRFRGGIIRGTGDFIGGYRPILGMKRLVHILGERPISSVIREAERFRSLNTYSNPNMISQAILSIYNRGLRSGRLPDWPDRPQKRGGS